MPKVGIVIVNYNGEKYQNDCIESLYNMTYKDFVVIVVDSGSTDDSIKVLRKSYPEVLILEQYKNVGVAKGNNIGIEFSINLGTEYTLLMNNDIVVDTQLLEELVKESENRKVVVPKIYYFEPKNLIWFGGGDFIFNKGLTVHYGMRQNDYGQFNEKKVIKYAPTCCMLIPNYVFKIVGRMDEKLFMYYDDTDFCLRLFEKNIEMVYQSKSFMWHKVSSSTGGEDSPLSVYYNTRNRFYFINKHSKEMPVYVMLYSLISNIVQYIISPIRCKNDKYIFDALKDYFTGNMGKKDLRIR